MKRMTIGAAAAHVGVAATTLRYYEREGLVAAAGRTGAGYRFYDDEAIERLRFIRVAQAVGFTLQDIRLLLGLDGRRDCGEVGSLIRQRLEAVDAKIAALRRLRSGLTEALDRCRQSTDVCAVLQELRGGVGDAAR
ncbi:MAG: MerR family transcriptional regulator [Phycisphaerae bacterium]